MWQCFACTAHTNWFLGTFPLYVSVSVSVYTHTHTEQCTPNNHKEEEHNLYPRETGACSMVLCHILQIWRTKVQPVLIFTTPGLPRWFWRSWVQICIVFYFDKSPSHEGEVCLCSNSPLPLSAPLACFSYPLWTINSRIPVLIVNMDLYGALEHLMDLYGISDPLRGCTDWVNHWIRTKTFPKIPRCHLELPLSLQVMLLVQSIKYFKKQKRGEKQREEREKQRNLQHYRIVLKIQFLRGSSLL